MKTMGLIGGMSWESTALYYSLINESIKEQLGGLHSGKILLYSVDFAEIEHLQAQGNWEKCNEVLTDIALRLQAAGAEGIAICTNTMHKVAPYMQERLTIPLVHIAEATAARILEQGLQKIALLGTKYTMEQNFYKQKLLEVGIEVLIPEQEGIQVVNDIIYKELCLGVVQEASRTQYKDIIAQLVARGAQGVILGCTEICLLISQEHCPVPVFDTTRIHAQSIAQYMLK